MIFRTTTLKKYLAPVDLRYKNCPDTPYFWAYVMADGSVYGCSAYLLDDRFQYGNLNQESFKDIWEGDKRRENWSFIKHSLNISDCRKNCRMDEVNRHLETIRGGDIPLVNTSDEDIPHVNFI